MKQNDINMERKMTHLNTLNGIYNFMLQREEFSAFHKEIRTYYDTQENINTLGDIYHKPKELISIDDNYIIYEDKQIFLTDHAWAGLNFKLKEKLREEENVQLPDKINPLKKLINDKLSRDTLIKFMENGVVSPKYKDLFLYLTENEVVNDFKAIIYLTLLMQVIPNKNKNKDLSISNLSIKFAQVIIAILADKNKFLQELVDILETSNFNKLKENKRCMSFMENLVKFSKEKNDQQVIVLFNSFGVQNTTIIDIMSRHIVKLFYNHFKMEENDLNNIFCFYDPIFMNRIYKENGVALVHIGKTIVNILENEGVLKSSINKSNNKTSRILYLQEECLLNFSDIYNIKKPSLIMYESSILLDKTDPNYLAYKTLSRKGKITKNDRMAIKISSRDLKNITLNNRFSIDLDSLIILMGFLLSNVESKHKRKDDFESFLSQINVQIFLSLYNISSTNVIQLIKKHKYNTLLIDELYKLINYALDFSNNYEWINSRSIKVCYKDKEWVEELINLINKINGEKFFLIGLIKDAILYSSFNYIVAHSMIDFRRRLYNQETFLNIQQNKMSKSILKLYARSNIEINATLINIFNVQLPYAKFPDVVTFNKENDLLFLEFFYKQLKNSLISFNDFTQFINVLKEIEDPAERLEKLLTFTHIHCKKLKETWFVAAIINRYLNKDPSSVVELDASQSGLQMISILYNDAELAYKCNLLGTKNNDVYLNSSIRVHNILEKLQKVLTTIPCIFETCNTLLKEDIEKDFFKEISIYSKDIEDYRNNCQLSPQDIFKHTLHCFFKMHFRRSTWIYQTLNYLYEDLKTLNITISKDIVEELIHVIPSSELKIMENCLKDSDKEFEMVVKNLFILRVAYKMQKYYYKYPWLNPTTNFWKDRTLFKKSVMTQPYNARRITRINDYHNFLKEKYTSLENNLFRPKKFNYLLNIIETIFTNDKEMKAILVSNKTLTNIACKETGAFIQLPNVKIAFVPSKQKSIPVETRDHKRKRRSISIAIQSNEIDLRQLKNSFLANLIHTMDATPVHKFNGVLYDLNKILFQKNYDLFIGSYTNHDSFACTIPLLIKEILHYAYIDLIKMNMLSRIEGIKEEDIKRLQRMTTKQFLDLFIKHFNPHFFKF
jgi:hypothetical protein